MATIWIYRRVYGEGYFVNVVEDGRVEISYRNGLAQGQEAALCSVIPVKWKVETAKGEGNEREEILREL